jgi:methyl-accepting chemotaxis protein
MGIKVKLILAIIFPILVSVAIVTGAVFFQINTTVEDNFHSSSSQQLQLINDNINEILARARNTSRFVAELDEVRNAVGKWTRYFTLDGPSKPTQFATDPSERLVYRLANTLKKANPDFAYVYMGLKDGGYTQDGTETLKNDYDPRKRPWYKEGSRSDGDTTLLSAYITTEGVPNIGVTTKIYDPSGDFVGVSAVDISLGKLSDIVDTIKVGKTGYVMVIQGDGVILADPRHEDYIFKNIEKLGEKSLAAIGTSKDGWLQDLELDGKTYFASVRTSEETGWKFVALIERSEVFAAANSAIFNIILIGIVAVGVFAVLGGYYVNRAVVGPVVSMAGYARQIGEGNYDSLPETCTYKDELRVLFNNLRTMVGELVKTISLAEDKTAEAEDKSRQAEQALAEAEEARKLAETAKRDGMLQAASELEQIVEHIAAASSELSAQINESKQGSDIQRERAAENATAMEEMNATVLEVASNAGQSAENAEFAKQEAQGGFRTMEQVTEAVVQLKQEAEKLGEEMEQLGVQAEAIGNVMNVITDIADQTNLLALNAAIEAARAGDAGRGFAVVADEVRKLAEKTMGATKEVGEAISSIQGSSRASMDSMTQTAEMVDSTTNLAGEAGSALESILDVIEKLAEQVRSIATAAEQQSATSEEINRATSEINRIADETSHAMEQSSLAMDQLAELSEKLNRVIDELKSS